MNMLSQFVLSELAKRRGLRLDAVTEKPPVLHVTPDPYDETAVDHRLDLLSQDVNRGRKPGTEIRVVVTG